MLEKPEDLDWYSMAPPAPMKAHALPAAQFQTVLRFPPASDEEYPRADRETCTRRLERVLATASEDRKRALHATGQRLAMLRVK